MKKYFYYLLFSAILFFISLYFYNVTNSYLKIKGSEYLGNNSSNIDRLKETEGKLPFSFGFISDTENNDDSIWLIRALLDSQIDFLVLIGDVANDSTQEEHKLVLYNIAKLNPNIPVFIVPSNHDIETAEDVNYKEPFRKQDFEVLYGPANISFIYNQCLFIFIANTVQDDKENIDYLNFALRKKDKSIKYTFLFCPTPPRILLDKIFNESSGYNELNENIKRGKIDYVVSGDYHKRIEFKSNDGTEYIISGSGGAHFAEKSLLGRFKSGTRMTVYKDGVEEEIIVKKGLFLTDNFIRHYIFWRIMPFLEHRMWLLNWLFTVSILNLLFSGYCFIRKLQV